MNLAICTVAAAPVRKEPSHRTEMVNQLLFGEQMEILEEKEEWFRIRSLYDNYEGWLTHHLVEPVQDLPEPRFYASSLTNPVTTPNSLINAPMGSSLSGFNEETRLLWKPEYKYHGTYRDVTHPVDYDLLLKTSHAWINAPYLWGGKTFMGVDCSGFVQTVFKILGVRLKRDAWQQCEQGKELEAQNVKEGDLAFFQNEQGRVTHVGIILEGNRIIHAAGKVRIDRLDAEGIMNVETGKRTHRLHSMKRYF